MARRVVLFLLTNLAVMIVLGLVVTALSYFGVFEMIGVPQGDTLWLMIFAGVFGFGGAIVSLFLSKTMAKRATGAVVIASPSNETEAWLLQTVEKHSRQLGLQRPEVAIFPSPSPNAFATGARKNAALVAVSDGLLRAMNREQVEAVIGHEMAHVANGDMVTLALLQGVLNTFVIFGAHTLGRMLDKVLFRGDGRGMGYYAVRIALEIVLSVLATMIVMAFSRYREFRADAGGAELEGTDSMISALAVLGNVPGDELPDEVAAFGVRGGVKDGLQRLFSSHPPIEVRIQKLRASKSRQAR